MAKKGAFGSPDLWKRSIRKELSDGISVYINRNKKKYAPIIKGHILQDIVNRMKGLFHLYGYQR